MAIAPELGIVFLVAFFVMLVAESLSMFPLPKCDEHCSSKSKKLICLYYKSLGYVDVCNG